MNEVEVIQVIRTTLTTRGAGSAKDPMRRLVQYWSMDGELLWENDPIEAAQDAALWADHQRLCAREAEIEARRGGTA